MEADKHYCIEDSSDDDIIIMRNNNITKKTYQWKLKQRKSKKKIYIVKI